MVLTSTYIVKYQYGSGSESAAGHAWRKTMLMPTSLAVLFQRDREREMQASYVARLAARIRDCCRPGRLARLTTLFRPQQCCARGAS